MEAGNCLFPMAFVDSLSRCRNQQVGTPICLFGGYNRWLEDFHGASLRERLLLAECVRLESEYMFGTKRAHQSDIADGHVG